MSKRISLGRQLWNWLNGKKTFIVALAGLVITFLITTHKIDDATAQLFSGILVLLGGTANIVNAKERAQNL